MQALPNRAAAAASTGPQGRPPATALIVVGQVGPAEAAAAPDPLWQAALPPARRVLAIGAEAMALVAAHRAAHPTAAWWGLCLPGDSAARLRAAPHALQALLSLDEVERTDDNLAPADIDLIVLSPAWAALPDASRRLAAWSAGCTADAQLLMAFDNAAAVPRLTALLQADDTPLPGAGPTGPALVPASVYKLLMDAGWMPGLQAHLPCEAPPAKTSRSLRYAAEAVGVATGIVDVVHHLQRLVVQARRRLVQAPVLPGAARFSVVVPTTEETQLRRNVEASPGLREVQAHIVSVRGARNPADALAQARPHCHADWVLLCHQDVYFAAGFGEQLNAVLAEVPAEARSRTVIGFIGMGVDRQSHQPVPAGHVIDRLNCADHPASDAVLSIDELALVVARDSLHHVDPELGWHLWATGLCLAAIEQHRVFPRIVRLPLFHNSRTGSTLPPAFIASAQVLLRKFPAFAPIHTLCGTLDASFVAHHTQAAA